MELLTALTGLIGALIGGWMAGKYSRQATQDLLEGQRKKRELEQKEEIRAFLCAILGEVKSVWTNYVETSGKMLEAIPVGQPVKVYFPIIADYFPIYHGNIKSLGLVEDENLRMQIISGYNTAKALVDTLRLNNEFNRQRDQASDQVLLNNASTTQRVLQIKEQALVAYEPAIRETHSRAKRTVEILIPLLTAAIKK